MFPSTYHAPLFFSASSPLLTPSLCSRISSNCCWEKRSTAAMSLKTQASPWRQVFKAEAVWSLITRSSVSQWPNSTCYRIRKTVKLSVLHLGCMVRWTRRRLRIIRRSKQVMCERCARVKGVHVSNTLDNSFLWSLSYLFNRSSKNPQWTCV